jgi:hypothetical protein
MDKKKTFIEFKNNTHTDDVVKRISNTIQAELEKQHENSSYVVVLPPGVKMKESKANIVFEVS